MAKLVLAGYFRFVLPESLKSLPYLVHTNRELGLMLRGVKPMAYFLEFSEDRDARFVRYFRLFDRHVETGRFGKHLDIVETQAPASFGRCERFFYVLPGEEWRVAAMISLLDRPRTSWSAAHEREFGQLLGYEEWQCDYWLERMATAI